MTATKKTRLRKQKETPAEAETPVDPVTPAEAETPAEPEAGEQGEAAEAEQAAPEVEPIAVGDIVQRGGAGPQMAVTSIDPDGAGLAWNVDGETLTDKAQVGDLVRVPAAVEEEEDPVEASLAAGFGITPALTRTIRQLWAEGQFLPAIRAYRDATGTDLPVALEATKALVESAPAETDDGDAVAVEPIAENEDGAEVIRLFAEASVDLPKAPPPRLRVHRGPPIARRGREIIGRTHGETSVKLTEEEFHERAARLAEMDPEIQAEEDEQASVRRRQKERLAALKAERSRLSTVVRERAEIREIALVLEADFGEGIVRELEEDTRREVSRRLLTEQERQLSLFPAREPVPEPSSDDGDPEPEIEN